MERSAHLLFITNTGDAGFPCLARVDHLLLLHAAALRVAGQRGSGMSCWLSCCVSCALQSPRTGHARLGMHQAVQTQLMIIIYLPI